MALGFLGPLLDQADVLAATGDPFDRSDASPAVVLNDPATAPYQVARPRILLLPESR